MVISVAMTEGDWLTGSGYSVASPARRLPGWPDRAGLNKYYRCDLSILCKTMCAFSIYDTQYTRMDFFYTLDSLDCVL